MNGQAQANPTNGGMTIEQQIFNENVDKFLKDLQELKNKYGIEIVPMLQTSPFGIVPQINYVDKKKHEEMIKRLTNSQGN